MIRASILLLFFILGLNLQAQTNSSSPTNSGTNSTTNSSFFSIPTPSMNDVGQWTSGVLSTAKDTVNKTVKTLAENGYLGSPEQSKVDRQLIPNASQEQFGNRSGNCVPNSFAHFVIWWDSEGFLALPKTFKKTDEKYEWVHEQLEKAFKTQYFGTKGSELTEGMETFFKKHYEGRAKIRTVALAPTIDNMVAATVGYNATVLLLNVRELGKTEEHHAVTLVTAEKTGGVSFITWGYRWEGKIVPYQSKSDGKNSNLLKIQFVDDPANPYRKEIQFNAMQFIINPETDALLCAIPTPLTDEEKEALKQQAPQKP